MKRPSLLSQILTLNLLMVTAGILAAVFTSGLDLAVPRQRWQFLVLAMALIATFLVNWILLKRRFAPIEQLLDAMERIDLSQPGRRLEIDAKLAGDSTDVQRLVASFNRMLERLERERLRSGELVLRAQEEERKRLARDLHDEVNQALTAVLLRIEAAAQDAPPRLRQEFDETKRLANKAMEELVELARQLRPTALDDHGLVAALKAQVRSYDHRKNLEANFWADPNIPEIAEDAQIVVYRVAQEALTNAARHSGAERVDVSLGWRGSKVCLQVSDNGRGFSFSEGGKGLGLSGMRERALLVGGKLTVDSRPGNGTVIRLEVPSSLTKDADHSHAAAKPSRSMLDDRSSEAA